MRLIPHKATGDTLTADEFNDIPSEEENLITSAGITLTQTDLYQIAKAVAFYASSVNFCVDSGVANAYILTPSAPKKAPPAYFNGMRISFRTVNSNTGSCTLNFNAYGVKTIVSKDGSTALSLGDIPANQLIEVVYNSGTGYFELTSTKTQTAQFATGDVVYTPATAARAGWITYAATGTIGDASSGSTIRANADCEALFKFWWNIYSNTVLPIYTSAGAVSTRGVSADADWLAHKRLTAVAYYDCVIASHSSVTGHVINSAPLGSNVQTLTGDNNGSHSHLFDKLITMYQSGASDKWCWGGEQNVPTGGSGSNAPFSILQPTLYHSFYVKL